MGRVANMVNIAAASKEVAEKVARSVFVRYARIHLRLDNCITVLIIVLDARRHINKAYLLFDCDAIL